MKQIPTSETVLQGHRDSVNALKFNADLTFLLSGGTLFYWFITLTTVLTDCLDNSGFIIIWDLALRAPFQKIDASCAGSVTSVCWINLLKNITPEDDSALAFAIGFGTGTIAIYSQTSKNVSFFSYFSFKLSLFLGLEPI